MFPGIWGINHKSDCAWVEFKKEKQLDKELEEIFSTPADPAFKHTKV